MPENPTPLQRSFQTVFGGDAGKEVLRYMMDRNGMYRTTHQPGDPYSSAFCEGQRDVMIDIMSQLRKNVSVEEWLDEMYDTDVDQLKRNRERDPTTR
jgi:hypothetical protein